MTRIESLKRDLRLQAKFLREDLDPPANEFDPETGLVPHLKTAETRLGNMQAMLHELIELSVQPIATPTTSRGRKPRK